MPAVIRTPVVGVSPKTGADGLSTTGELGRYVADHEDQDHDGQCHAQPSVLIAEPCREEVGHSDAVVPLREVPETPARKVRNRISSAIVYPTTDQSAEAPWAYAIPVTPSSNQELLPDTTAESATTTRFIRRPPMKNSLTPADENRAE